MSNLTVVLVTVLALMSVAWVNARCLADLARTGDRDLRYLNRNAWALVILVSFPIGPVLYLRYGKGPGSYRG